MTHGSKLPATHRTKHISSLLIKLELASCDLTELDQRMTRLDHTIKTGEETLNTPKYISEKLNEMDILLLALEGALNGLSLIVVIAPVTQPLAKAVTAIKEVVKPIKSAVENLEKLIKPLRKYLHQVRQLIEELLPPLHELTTFAQLEHQRAHSAYQKLEDAEESRYRKSMEDSFDDIAKRLNAALETPLHSLTNSLERVNQSADSLDKALRKCNELAKTLAPITETVEQLQALDDELNQVKAILNQKISAPPIEMSVQDVLAVAGKNPVFDELVQIAMQLLKEPLRELKERAPGCPNFVNLIETFESVYQLLNLIKEMMSSAELEIRKLTKDKYLMKIFDRIEVEGVC